MATGKRMTDAKVIAEMADMTGFSKKQIQMFFDALRTLIKRELSRRGPGEFIIPGLLKLYIRRTQAEKNAEVRIPGSTEIKIVDRKASKKLKATPLKKLKDMVL